MEYRGCLVYDGDDTLWFNTFKYHLPAVKCNEIICRDLGVYSITPLEVQKLVREIDERNIKILGFSRKRFPMSWVMAYRKLCAMRSLKPKKNVAEKLYREASKFYQPPFPLKTLARETLKEMQSRGFYQVLLTLGDKRVQRLKIHSTGLGKFFNEIRIPSADKTHHLEELSLKFGEKIWMIGNSKKSDIGAAIGAKVKAFYIPWATSLDDSYECDQELYRQYVTELKNISELTTISILN